MATLILDVSDELAAYLDALSPSERAAAENHAVAALLIVDGDGAPPSTQKAAITPLRPFHEYASEEEYVAAAVAGARAAGLDPGDAYGIARGIADGEMGREIAFEDYVAEMEAERAARRTAKRAAATANEDSALSVAGTV